MEPLAVAPDREPPVGTETVPVMFPHVALSYVSYVIEPLAVAPDKVPLVGTDTDPVIEPQVALSYVS
jgi:hypothetical protein